MKKLLSLLTVAALLLCLLSTSAFAAALIGIDEKGDGVTSGNVQPASGNTATIIDQNGTIISSGTGNAATVYTGKVYITKNPLGEKVQKGGSATFTAYASSGAAPTWRLVSSDTLETIYAAGAGQFFDGVTVTGAYTNRLTISNISDNMNHWQVEAMFDDGEGGHVFSAGAMITVIGSTANGTTTDKNPYGRTLAIGGNGAVPSINGQPTGATLTSGKSTTLSVTAGTDNGGKLLYQWYVSNDAELTNPQAIAGATSASYTPGELPGTRYYYCAVWSEKDDVKSATVNSDVVAVTYPEAAASPAPSPSPSPAPSSTANAGTSGTNTNTNTNANSNTGTGSSGTANTNSGTSNSGSNTAIAPAPSDAGTQPQPTPEAHTASGVSTSQVDSETRSSLPVILGAIAAVALAAGVGLLVLRRNSGQ